MTLTREKVYEKLKEELQRIEDVQEEENNGKDREEIEDNREPLSIDLTKQVRILLSWGGPEDGFKLRFDRENNLLGGVYYMADWGEYQEIELEDEESDKVFNFYMCGELIE